MAVSDPTRFAAGTFSALLKREGIRIQGKVLTGTTPPEARLLIRQNSRPLGEIIRGLNKHSNNLMAEQILKTMGAEMFGLPGTTEKGLLAVRELLVQAGVPPSSFILADASGLSRVNKITPKAIVAVLESMSHDFRLFPEYLASLAVVGVWIVREPEGFYALIATCTHLGCTPNWLASENKFKCPCHGSGFYRTGVNFEGPAPRPLERARIVLAEDGQLLVDKSTKFQQEKGEWEKPEAFLQA